MQLARSHEATAEHREEQFEIMRRLGYSRFELLMNCSYRTRSVQISSENNPVSINTRASKYTACTERVRALKMIISARLCFLSLSSLLFRNYMIRSPVFRFVIYQFKYTKYKFRVMKLKRRQVET